MPHGLQQSVATVVVAVGWVTIGWLVFARDVGSHAMVSPLGVSALLLFVAVPYLSFLPLARRWRAPFFEVEAAVGWGVFLAVLAFLRPADSPSTLAILAFLGPLTVALAGLCTAIAFATARRLARVADDVSFVDARRRGYFAAISLIALGMLGGLGVLAPVMALLLVVVVVLAELLISLRPRSIRQRPAAPAGS